MKTGRVLSQLYTLCHAPLLSVTKSEQLSVTFISVYFVLCLSLLLCSELFLILYPLANVTHCHCPWEIHIPPPGAQVSVACLGLRQIVVKDMSCA